MTEPVTLTDILAAALHETFCAEEGLCPGYNVDRSNGEEMARWVTNGLRNAGYAVHNVRDGRCVRPTEPKPAGRAMTEEEQEWASSVGSSSGALPSST